MPEFQLKSVDFGWDHVEIPDDITFELIREDSTLTLSASLEQLATIQGCATNECYCEFFLGTGSPVAIKPTNGAFTLKIETISIKFRKEDLVEQIEELIKAVFEAKDRQSPSIRTEKKLRKLDDYTESYYCSSSLEELYASSDAPD